MNCRHLHIFFTGLMGLLWFSAQPGEAASAVSDELALSNPVITTEFSPDGNHIIWVERIRTPQGLPLIVYYAPLKADGTFSRAMATNVSELQCAAEPSGCSGGESCLCGPTDFRGTPQWGQAALKAGDPSGASTQFAVYLRDDTGDIVFLRADGADGSPQQPDLAPDDVRFVATDCDQKEIRQTPYPIRNAASEKKWTVYTTEVPEDDQQCANRPMGAVDSTCLQLWAVDLDEVNGCSHTLIYDEYRFPAPQGAIGGGAPNGWSGSSVGTALQLGWFRWGAETSYLFHGATFPSYAQTTATAAANPPTVVMQRVDFENDFLSVVSTGNGLPPATYNLIDTFPFGDQYLVAGLYDKASRLATDTSRVYRSRGGDTGAYAVWYDFTWRASQETQIPAGNAFAAQSYEGFVWNGDPYVVYVILDSEGDEQPNRTQWGYPGEIWVQKLEDPGVNCVVSELTAPTARFEPEPIIAHNERAEEIVRIYYNESKPTLNPSALEYNFRMITITNQEEFDRQCRAGDVWDY